ncbi:hypothetical protein [Leucobacter sp. NPDC077196]|uniref:hypothetical protein n=1 Tax=Leucobacter sp. NPDC077196 TaxID=3154959 RepID=UPI0034302A51
MAELDYDELQRLADAATEGPWKWTHEPGDDEGALRSSSEERYVLCANGLHTEGFIAVGVADAEFIAAARSAVPALLDRVRELESQKVCEHQNADYLRMMAERDAALSTIAKVEALHTSEGWPLPGGRESKEYCTRCNCRWPCPTIRALGSVPSTGEGNDG